ncbi:MAG: P-loop NTPase [Spirochaetes bacterium]|jgi:flagellar biosynthesis protein FlhG|nr:P-loop NTPase [Spirochaetota bacterium]
MQIIPIASGKGGVGKSILAANLAIALAQSGKRTVVVDLDLGGSNLHIILGMRNVAYGLGTFLTHSGVTFDQIVLQTDQKNLHFVPGDAEIPGLANLSSAQKRMLIRRLTSLEADYLILDLGAGTSLNTLDFFLISRAGLIVSTPTPTSTVNAYLFLKNAMFRLMQNACKKKSPGDQYLQKLRKQSDTLQRVYVPQIIDNIAHVDPESFAKLEASLGRFRPRIVLNMLEDPKDADKAHRLRRSCRQYLNLDLEHLGVVYRDDLQDIALASALPIIRYKPQSIISQAVYRIADKLVELEMEDEGPLAVDAIDETYEEADMEASADFDTKQSYVEELLHSGTLTTGDLIETIKNQQLEIRHLRKENMLYKSKLVKAIQQGYRT